MIIKVVAFERTRDVGFNNNHMKNIGQEHFDNNNKKATRWIAFIICLPFSCVSLYILGLGLIAIFSIIEHSHLVHGSEILIVLPFALGILAFQLMLYRKTFKNK